LVKFDVYQKFKLDCGFPKRCGEMTAEELSINGKCGLEEFLSKPLKVGIAEPKFDAQGNIIPKNPRKNPFLDVKKTLSEWRDKMNECRKNTWDFKSNIDINTWNKNITLNNFMQIANNVFPILSELVPQECLNTVCETQRRVKGADSIGSLSDTMLNATKESALLIKDAAKAFMDASATLVKDIGNYASNAVDNALNLVKTFNVFNLCPRRFGDWLEDAKDSFGVPPSLDKFTQIQNMFSNTLLGQFGKVLNECVLKTATKQVINGITELRAKSKTTINLFSECR
jgi:hypothetical protein